VVLVLLNTLPIPRLPNFPLRFPFSKFSLPFFTFIEFQNVRQQAPRYGLDLMFRDICVINQLLSPAQNTPPYSIFKVHSVIAATLQASFSPQLLFTSLLTMYYSLAIMSV
jgi:hypothetical protein